MTPSLSFSGPLDAEGPLVSVIVPTYEDREYVRGALESVDAQTYRPIEVVLVDSSDVAELRGLAAETEGMTYVYQEPQGLGAARNAGIESTTGDVIAFLDADDRWYPEKLAEQVAAIKEGAGFVYSDAYVESDDGSRQYFSALSVENPATHHVRFFKHGGIPCPTVAVSRPCLDGHWFDESLSAVEDRHMWTRLLATPDCRPVRIDRPLATYRRRGGSMSSDVDNMYKNELRVIEDLVDRIPGLEPYRDSVMAKAEYKRGKRYLRIDRRLAARRAFREAIQSGMDDVRVYLLLGLTYLPLSTSLAFAALERAEMTVRRLVE